MLIITMTKKIIHRYILQLLKCYYFLILVAINCLFFDVSNINAQDLFVTNYSTNHVLRYDGATGDFIDVFDSGGNLYGPSGIVFGPDGNLYVASGLAPQILRYRGTTGEFIDAFVSGSGLLLYGLNPDRRLAFGPDGNLYVSEHKDAFGVVRYNGETGEFIDVFTSGGGHIHPSGIVFGPDGNLYVTDDGYGGRVIRYDGTTGDFIDVFVTEGDLNYPLGLVFGPEGNLYVTVINYNRVNRYNGTTGEFIDVFASGGGLSYPTDIVFGPDGNLYVVSSRTNQILRYNGRTGDFIDVFAEGGGLLWPVALAFHRFPLPQLPPTPTPTPIPGSSQKCQAGSLTLPITTIPPVCQCLKDGSARELRCGLLNPDFLLVFRTPIPILPGKPFELSWTLVPLTKIPGDVYVNTVLPQNFKLKDKKTTVMKFPSDVDVDKSSKVKLLFIAPEKQGNYPLKGRVMIADKKAKKK